MKDKLGIGEMIQSLRKDMEAFPDHRTGHNKRYEVADAGMAAFSVFLLNQPHFWNTNAQSTCSKGARMSKVYLRAKRYRATIRLRTLRGWDSSVLY